MYFPTLSLLLARHHNHNRCQIHGITWSILGVWVPSKYNVPFSSCIRWIWYSWNGDKCWLTRHNMQFIPDGHVLLQLIPSFVTDVQYSWLPSIGSNCTNQVSCTVSNIAAVATIAMIPADGAATGVATNAALVYTQSWSSMYPTYTMYLVYHT